MSLLLQENGGRLLLEQGGSLLVSSGAFIVQESGGRILLEQGGALLLESEVGITGTGDFTAPLGEMAGIGVVGEAPEVTVPALGGSGRRAHWRSSIRVPLRRKKLVAIIGSGGMLAPLGEMAGTGIVQDWLAELQRQDEELLELIEMGIL